MASYNLIHKIMPCPRCGRESELEFEVFFGDTRYYKDFEIGNEYPWICGKSYDRGGPPKDGTRVDEGYAECPRCERDFFTKVYVKNNILTAVEVDYDKAPYILEPPFLKRPKGEEE